MTMYEPKRNNREPIYSPSRGQSNVGQHFVADPHIGIMAPLKELDAAERQKLIMEGRNYVDPTVPASDKLHDESCNVILIMGGINPRYPYDFHLHGSSVYVYIVEKNKYFFGGTLPEPRCYHAVAFYEGNIFLTGGFCSCTIKDGEFVATRSVYQLSIRNKKWSLKADMHQCRAHHGICTLNKQIAVIGGKDEKGRIISAVEVYNVDNNEWSFIHSLPKALMAMGIAVLDNTIHVLGGITFLDGEYQMSRDVYAYDMKNPGWLLKCKVPEALAFCSAITIRREIWLLGGMKEPLGADGHMASSDTIHTMTSTPDIRWDKFPDRLSLPKHSTAVAKAMGRKIFIIGGMSSRTKEPTDQTDIADGEMMRIVHGVPLPQPLTGSAAVSVPPDQSDKLLQKWAEHLAPDPVQELAATKIQAQFRGHRIRSAMSQYKGTPMYKSTLQTLADVQSRYPEPTPILHVDSRTYKHVTIAQWPPSDPLPTELPSFHTMSASQFSGYAIIKTERMNEVKRYITLSLSCDPNLGRVKNVGDSDLIIRKALGLRKMEPLPYKDLGVKDESFIKDDCIPIILLLGGLNVSHPTNTAFGRSVLKYHPLKRSWGYVGTMPEARNHHAAAYLDDIVYVSGGLSADLRNSGEMVATKSLFAMSVSSGKWIQKHGMISSRAFHSLVPFKGKLYAIGGRNEFGGLVASIECYDPKTNLWSIKRPMSEPRMGLTAVVFEDAIWCLGGVGPSENSGAEMNALTTVASYDTNTDSWRNRPALRCPRAFGFCLNIHNELYMCAGCCRIEDRDILISMASVDQYNSAGAGWQRKTNLLNPRHCSAVTTVGNCIFFFGGMGSQELYPTAHNEMFVTSELMSYYCSDLPCPLTGAAAVTIPQRHLSMHPADLSSLLQYHLKR